MFHLSCETLLRRAPIPAFTFFPLGDAFRRVQVDLLEARHTVQPWHAGESHVVPRQDALLRVARRACAVARRDQLGDLLDTCVLLAQLRTQFARRSCVGHRYAVRILFAAKRSGLRFTDLCGRLRRLLAQRLRFLDLPVFDARRLLAQHVLHRRILLAQRTTLHRVLLRLSAFFEALQHPFSDLRQSYLSLRQQPGVCCLVAFAHRVRSLRHQFEHRIQRRLELPLGEVVQLLDLRLQAAKRRRKVLA